VPRSPRKQSPAGRTTAALTAGVISLGFVLSAQSAPAFAKTSAPASHASSWGSGTLTDAELIQLISQFTVPEKATMIHGGTDTTCATATVGCVGQAGIIPGVSRLGIPPLRLADGPAGIRLSYATTALPAPVGLTAAFDRQLAYDFGQVMGTEGRATNQDVLLSPMVNQVTVATAGRNFESLGGEDAYLAGELVGPEIKGVQDEGLIATVKHFVENDFENSRSQTSVAIDKRTLQEGELQAFEKAATADVGAVMCSYNRVNGVFGCSNGDLMNATMRDKFGFSGFVMSDWGATHRLGDMAAGLDIQMWNGSIFSEANVTAALTSGTPGVAVTNDNPAVPAYSSAQWQAVVDLDLFHVLTAMNKAGLLEGTEFGSRYTGTPQSDVPARPVLATLKSASAATAQRVAEESATLLKNNDSALPLTAADFRSSAVKADKHGDKKGGVVVMGPTSVTPYVGGGGSANVTPYDNILSPYEALKSVAPVGADATYTPGYDLDGTVVPASALLAPSASAFSGASGLERSQISTTLPAAGSAPTACTGTCTANRLDPTVDYTTQTLPAGTAYRWLGTVNAPSDGAYQLKVFVQNQSSAQLYLAGGLTNTDQKVNLGAFGVASAGIGGSTVSSWNKLTQTAKSHDPQLGKFQQGAYSVTLAAGQPIQVDLRAYANPTIGAAPLKVRFEWITPTSQDAAITAAVRAAKSANKVVLFAYDEGTEGSDRGGDSVSAGLALPGYQDALTSAVSAVNPNTVVVLNTGDAVLMPWINSVKAVLEMWYPGQVGGVATANVLVGRVNPSGKSPVTFPASGTQVPQFDPSCTDPAVTGNCPLYPGVAGIGNLGTPTSYRSIDYTTNGIFTGYRWYDKNDQTPLFEFGHGLSYTSFAYKNLWIKPTADGVTVSFTVTNTGKVSGTEVAQVYVGGSAKSAPVELADKALAGFTRVTLQPKKSRVVSLNIKARALSFWSVRTHTWELATKDRSVSIGSSSRDIRLAREHLTLAAPSHR
jgi:beta-glucosidase